MSAEIELKYPENLTLPVGTRMADITPEITGEATEDFSFSVSPQLPKGLSLDKKTGAITGKPENPGAGKHTIKAAGAKQEIASIIASPLKNYAAWIIQKEIPQSLITPFERWLARRSKEEYKSESGYSRDYDKAYSDYLGGKK
jgi:hypothetical protein